MFWGGFRGRIWFPGAARSPGAAGRGTLHRPGTGAGGARPWAMRGWSNAQARLHAGSCALFLMKSLSLSLSHSPAPARQDRCTHAQLRMTSHQDLIHIYVDVYSLAIASRGNIIHGDVPLHPLPGPFSSLSFAPLPPDTSHSHPSPNNTYPPQKIRNKKRPSGAAKPVDNRPLLNSCLLAHLARHAHLAPPPPPPRHSGANTQSASSSAGAAAGMAGMLGMNFAFKLSACPGEQRR